MTPFQRGVKRTVIVLVYIVIISAITAALYYIFRAKPACDDKRLNQGEEKIDCGGPCSPCEEIPDIENLRISTKEIVPAGENKYDVLVKLENPNSHFGAGRFDYTFSILDKAGKIIDEKKEASFILPGQKKYLLAFNLESSEDPSSLDFKISSFQWTKFSEYQEPDINIYSKEFGLVSGGAGFAQFKGRMKNQSDYDFKRITVKAVLRNGDGVPVAVNETGFNDVRVGEEREIILNWPNPFAVDPTSVKIEVEPEVDVFSSDNFMKKYGTRDQYESYNLK